MMYVEGKNSRKTVFRNLKMEDIFRMGDKIFMKIAKDEGCMQNAYNFTDHKMTTVPLAAVVEYTSSALFVYVNDNMVESPKESLPDTII